jgi:hypothetical protein
MLLALLSGCQKTGRQTSGEFENYVYCESLDRCEYHGSETAFSVFGVFRTSELVCVCLNNLWSWDFWHVWKLAAL